MVRRVGLIAAALLLATRWSGAAAVAPAGAAASARPATAEFVESCVFGEDRTVSCRFARNGKPTSPRIAHADAPIPAKPKSAACPWFPVRAAEEPDPSGPQEPNADADPRDAKPAPARLNAVSLASLLGSPWPYSAVATSEKVLLIYRVSNRPRARDRAALLRLNEEIFSLFFNVPPTGETPAFTVDFQVPHAAALGDLAARVQSLHSANLSVQDVGSDTVRVTGTSGTPSCESWAAFVDQLHKLVWSVRPEAPLARVFFHAAGDVSNALAGTGAPAAGSTAAKPTVSEAALGAETVIFSDSTPGDDADLTEKKRIIAAFDLPRPEMMINTWMLQQSTNDRDKNTRLMDEVRKTVDEHNDGIQKAILDAWGYLRHRMMKPGTYFDQDFYNYVVPAVVFDASRYGGPTDGLSAGEIVTRTLRDQDVPRKNGLPGLSSDENIPPVMGLCRPDRYCLGYSTFFQAMQPRLTTMLMAILAAREPGHEADCAVDFLESPWLSGNSAGCKLPEMPASPQSAAAGACAGNRRSDRCRSAGDVEGLVKSGRLTPAFNLRQPLTAEQLDGVSCEQADQMGALRSLHEQQGPPAFFMECFRRTVRTLAADNAEPDRAQSSSFGLARAAVADFLFHYKMSQLYPHEFTPWDLTQSADQMNKVLRPLIDAFNRDLTAFQQVSQALLREKTDREASAYGKPWYGSGKNHFSYDALVTVHTVSGNRASVDTTSENYLDTLSTPTAAALLNSITGALPGVSGSSSAGTTTSSTETVSGTTTTTNSTTAPTATQPAFAGLLSNMSLNEAQAVAGL